MAVEHLSSKARLTMDSVALRYGGDACSYFLNASDCDFSLAKVSTLRLSSSTSVMDIVLFAGC
ncbi:hypothetical protein BVRB_4g086230 [Beta vulgaris subsp. vulgaris]|nr:hypothetical protein BVRB_4g086230 [Beta vulgaris subsp. vulgaris]